MPRISPRLRAPELSSEPRGIAVRERPRREGLAVNLYDLLRVDESYRDRLLAGLLDLDNPIYLDRTNGDEVALELRGDLFDLATRCDLLRADDAAHGRSPCRLYVRRGASG